MPRFLKVARYFNPHKIPYTRIAKTKGYVICYMNKELLYRKENMYMQDVLQPKSVIFTVCMI